jgi:predicted O-methyltransferase YrrM
MKQLLKSFLNQLPYVKGLHNQTENFNKNSFYPAGHYYSPIASVDTIKERQNEIWKEVGIDKGIKGIDLNVSGQLELLGEFSAYYDEIPFAAEKKEGLRYRFENSFYSYTDGIMLYSMIRHFTPKRIVEIGSGYSSALMMDTNERFFDGRIRLTFVEPYPERLYSLMSEKDKAAATVLEKPVQEIDPAHFSALEPGDILFIDSSHVAKCGSDVNYIFFEIFPLLQKGVLIHFHDIFYPFEYPKEWVFNGWGWNEDYFLKAFLMYNDQFAIRLFSHYLHLHHREAFAGMPLTYRNTGGNFWMEKTRG